jgi:ketosteroid isomerase-like protein
MESTVETVAAWYGSPEDWTQAKLQELTETSWHPEIEWRAIEGAADDVGPIRGAEALTRYYGEWIEIFDGLRNEVLEQHEAGDLVVLLMRVTGRSRSAGVPAELIYAMVIEVSDGKILRGREYATVDEALAAASSNAAWREGFA